ncbi:peptide MFS transporter [Roseateles violae]|uniref:Oligopeptide:H+ symporter n=1 Tax=Roseateles violae TaxID=3058042 RepID=A0ABT8DK44_9BURK|nr:oligopeptide:H+ symporter [Pelomonas sp. PFR6]MDN3918789.1 oligopeptide:H+ symporter [Pelomonas sp. PFR6]
MSSTPLAPAAAPVPGARALFFIQVFSTLGFAVLQSTLVLYATKHLGFSDRLATALMGVFGAFNYGLHLFGGYLGGRFLSNRNLFVGGMLLQVLGCAAIAGGTAALMYWGLALFLTGSGLNVTCINMMLTQRFAPEDERRESAFLWNYAGMNVGFFIGFTVAGQFQLSQDYATLFTFATAGNLLAVLLAALFWPQIRDLDTPLLAATPRAWRRRFAAGAAILIGLVPALWLMLQAPDWAGLIVKAIGVLVFLGLLLLTLRHPVLEERRRMAAYLILSLGSLAFWSLYQMAFSGLQLFYDRNVDPMIGRVQIAPQWVQNINTVVIVIGGPLLAWLFTRLRARGWAIDVPRQFAAAVLLMGLSFVVLPLGIGLADPATGRSAFAWIGLCYVLQSVGELLISPVGYAMIGRLAPRQYQGVMMGAWMLATGLASLFANDFSGSIPQAPGNDPRLTNGFYSVLFGRLGWGTVGVGVVMLLLIPRLRRLIEGRA